MTTLVGAALASGFFASLVLRVYAFALAVLLILIAGALSQLLFQLDAITGVGDAMILIVGLNCGYALGVLLQAAARFFFIGPRAGPLRGMGRNGRPARAEALS